MALPAIIASPSGLRVLGVNLVSRELLSPKTADLFYRATIGVSILGGLGIGWLLSQAPPSSYSTSKHGRVLERSLFFMIGLFGTVVLAIGLAESLFGHGGPVPGLI